MADADVVSRLSQEMAQALGQSLVKIGSEMQKLDRISKDAVSSSGGIGKLDTAFASMGLRLLGPVGLVAGLYQVSNALSTVAAQSVQMQAFSRNTGMASENIKDFQLQLQMMGKSSEEAKNTIASINGILNNFSTYKEESSLAQTMYGREGGAAFLNRLTAAKDRLGQIDEILRTYRSGNEQQKRGLADIFTGGDVDVLDRLATRSEMLRFTFQNDEAAMRKYHEATVLFETNVSNAWKAVSGNVIKALNDMTGGIEGSRESFETGVKLINNLTDTLFNGRTFGEGFWASKFNFGGLKRDIEDIKAAYEWLQKTFGNGFNTDIENYTSGGGGLDIKPDYRNYPQADDPMGADYSRRQFYSKEYWRNQFRPSGGTSGSTDFSGMRRTQSIEEDQSKTLVDIRDILQRMEGGPGGSGSGGGSSGGSGNGGFSFGSNNGGSRRYGGFTGKSANDFAASRGATGANTSAAMKAAKDQLRAEGVPEANLDHAAAMLVGQAQAESGLNPNTVHDGGTGYGVYGARLGRRTQMLNWLKENGYANNSLEGQMKYMAHEAMTGKDYAASRNALMGASADTMAAGTSVLTQNFERPAVDNSSTRLAHARAALNGGLVRQPGDSFSFGGNVLERQGDVAAVRRGRLNSSLRTAFDYASSRTGLTADVTSGGQRMHGAPGAVGSHRHDNGNAADFNLRDSEGNIVSPNDPRALEFYRYAAQAGVTGGGHSYMSDPNKILLDRSGGVYAGGKEFRDAIARGQRETDVFAAAARARMDAAKNSGTENSLKATIDFNNVPSGVKTNVETEGEIFKDLQVSKSRQNEVAGGSPGQPFAGVW